MVRPWPAAIGLVAAIALACTSSPGQSSALPTPAPTTRLGPPTTGAATATPEQTASLAPTEPSDESALYTPYPDPPGTFADCRPYAADADPTPTPAPGTTPGPTFDAGALVPCGRAEWEQALSAASRAIGRDHHNFCDAYWPVSVTDPGSWRLVINFVDGADPAARAQIEGLIQPGAPVEWRDVKYSWGFLSNLMDHQLPPVFGAARLEQVNTVALDVIADAVRVETRGEQPELTAMLVQEFGVAVVVVAGPSEAPRPI